jgi:competence protein ComEC
MAMLAQFLNWSAQLDWAVMDWPAPSLASTVIASLGIMVASANVLRGPARRWRHMGWLGLLFIFGPQSSAPAFGEMQVRVIDVGQGSAVLVRTKSHALLFDTGPAIGESDAGERMVMPTLRRLSVRALNRMVVSHFDRDHSGGLASVLAMTDVHALMVPLEEEARTSLQDHRWLQREHVIEQCRSGDQWRWDGVHFMVLHPVTPSGRRDRNLDSCVLRIEDRHGGSILLTGDIPMSAERRLVGQFTMLRDPELDQDPHPDGAKLASNVIIAPHHGSKTSTGAELLAVVAPSLVVIQSGYRNRFGHPHPEVLDRIAAASATNSRPIEIARTDLQGAIDISWLAGQPVARDFFADHRRYWHAPRSP